MWQAGVRDPERSRCVAVRRLDVGALRQPRIDAMEFGVQYAAEPCSSLLPLTLPALITARVRLRMASRRSERCAQRGVNG